jgi:hypothetical protein
VDEPIDWQPETQPGGGVRVHVVPPAGLPERGPVYLTVEATSTIPGGRGPLALPRVLPVGARVADELWVAWTEPSLALRPTAARGLAWIDPRLVSGPPGTGIGGNAGGSSPAPPLAPVIPAPEGLRGTLAWRWIAPQGEGRVDRQRVDSEVTGTVDMWATVDRARVRFAGQIVVQAGEDTLATLPLAASADGPDVAAWHFEDEATGLELQQRPIDPGRQAALGLPTAARAWELVLPHPRRGRIAIQARLERPWAGRGAMPLLVLPERFHTRGTFIIEVERSIRSTVTASGLRALDPRVAALVRPSDESAAADPSAYRRGHAYGYSSAGGALELKTEVLELLATGAVIREAVLTTTLNPQGPSRQRLLLRIASDRTQFLELVLPEASTLARVLRDGLPLTPTREGRGVTIPLVTPRAVRGFSTITIDYLTRGESNTPLAVLHPRLPSTSLPCLSFCWEILAPEPWIVTGSSPELLPTDKAPAGLFPASLRRSWAGSWPALGRLLRQKRPEPPGAALLRSLDALVITTRPDEVTLGEWFSRWDSSSAPVVIDRLALAAAGWGPRSRVVPPHPPAPGTGAAETALKAMGLRVVAVSGIVVITGQKDAQDHPIDEFRADVDGDAVPLHQAVAWGSDRTDRFQSVTRWRGEATPKVSILGESTESEPVRDGWRAWRLTASGWPGPDAAVELVDSNRRGIQAWAVGLAVVLAGVVARRLSPGVRAPGLVLLAAATTVGLAITPAAFAPWFQGALGGVLCVAFIWLGRSIPGRIFWPSHVIQPPSTVRRINPGVATVLLAAVVTAALASRLAARTATAEHEGREPVIALYPYDGPPDPDRRPDRVLLRREDAERLEGLAASARAPSSPVVHILAAAHRVYRQGQTDLGVESDYLLSDNPVPAAPGVRTSWTFPVEDSSDITATLDGRPVPVQIQPLGRTASVVLDDSPGAERRTEHRLKLRRTARLHRGVAEDVLRLAINPLACASVEVEDALPGRPHIEVTTARGRIGTRGQGGGVAGLLGPAERLEIRWSERSEPAPGGRAGGVEALLLWDARLAGDHVQARFTYQGSGSTSTIRIGVEPGVLVRAGDLPGMVDAGWVGSDESPEWVASFDPPLADGATVPLEFWRPAGPEAPEARALPRIEPLGVERYSGMLAFRRPPYWSGRLWPGAGLEPTPDEAFVKAWGTLPEEPLVLAGAGRFTGSPTLSIATGPAPSQLLVDTDVQLTIESGRIAVNVDAELTTLSGHSDRVELAVPPALETIAVEANGLTDWNRPAPDRLVLRFGGLVLNRRDVRIQAWLPVPTDPLATGLATPEVEPPWPLWQNADVRSGQLTIVSRARFQLVAASGAAVLSAPASLAPTSGTEATGYRAVYRVDRPEALGRLTWEVEPPRLGVLVLSQLTILPDVALWVAVLRYDVAGGAAEALHLRLPSAWAATARVQVVGDDHRRITETRGSNTYWTIQPAHPIWGSQRLIIRSAMPLPKSAALTFPDLSPLGRGAVDTYLALVNASGGELVKEGSPGLQPIVDETRFASEEFAGPPGMMPSLYHVRRDAWSLKVHAEGQVHTSSPSSDDVRVSLAEITCILRDDGAADGAAVYEVVPRSGPFLAIEPPQQSEPLWAAANVTPAPILRSASGRWLIPIPAVEDPVNRSPMPVQVRLIWRTAPAARGPTGAQPVALPALSQPNVPTLVTIHTPRALEIKSPNGSFGLVARERLESARLEWQARRIGESLGTLDRGSQRECDALVSSLVQLELLERDARRAALWNQSSPLTYREVRLARLDERIKLARGALGEALHTAGLDEFAESARIHVGLVRDPGGLSTLGVPEPIINVRLRCLGRPRYFQGESTFKDRPPVLTWTTVPERSLFQNPLEWALLLLGTTACALAATFAVAVAARARWLVPMTMTAALVALAVVAGPLALVAGTVMGGLGWLGREL